MKSVINDFAVSIKQSMSNDSACSRWCDTAVSAVAIGDLVNLIGGGNRF